MNLITSVPLFAACVYPDVHFAINQYLD